MTNYNLKEQYGKALESTTEEYNLSPQQAKIADSKARKQVNIKSLEAMKEKLVRDPKEIYQIKLEAYTTAIKALGKELSGKE